MAKKYKEVRIKREQIVAQKAAVDRPAAYAIRIIWFIVVRSYVRSKTNFYLSHERCCRCRFFFFLFFLILLIWYVFGCVYSLSFFLERTYVLRTYVTTNCSYDYYYIM